MISNGMNGRFILSAGLLAGTIIGAGVFALPYLTGQIGAVTGLFYLLAGTFVYYLLHRMYAAVVTTAPSEHQFFYLARTYFPPRAASLASFVILGELLFVLVVYLALAPAFIRLIVPLSPEASTLLFWCLGSLFIFARLSWQGVAEVLGTLFIAGIVGIVLVAGDALPFTVPAFRPPDLGLVFLPLGPLLFSFSGRPALHGVVEVWRRAAREGKPFSLARAIFAGTFIPALFYIVFIFAVLRLAPSVTPEALDSLSTLPSWLLSVLGLMGLITLWTSYFMIGANVKDIVHLDLKFPAWAGAMVTLAVPLALSLSGFNTFLSALSFTGSIFLGLEGILVVLLWRRAFPAHRFRTASLFIALIFALAVGYEIALRIGLL